MWLESISFYCSDPNPTRRNSRTRSLWPKKNYPGGSARTPRTTAWITRSTFESLRHGRTNNEFVSKQRLASDSLVHNNRHDHATVFRLSFPAVIG